MEKVRHLSAAARPARATAVAVTLESRDAELAAALLELKASPTAESHLAVGELYRRRGVLDAAYRHYNAAVKLEPHNAAAYEGLARTWRDWKLPALAAGDAARARFYAPASASIQNTFGTIMQALGRRDDARSRLRAGATSRQRVRLTRSTISAISRSSRDECRSPSNSAARQSPWTRA